MQVKQKKKKSQVEKKMRMKNEKRWLERKGKLKMEKECFSLMHYGFAGTFL